MFLNFKDEPLLSCFLVIFPGLREKHLGEIICDGGRFQIDSYWSFVPAQK
jgi:hypothetical protein